MKLLQLHLKAFGPFTDRVLDLAPAGEGLVLIHGPNEAGKSSTLRAISDLRFGIDHVSADNFVHDYADLRVGGVFLDAGGRRHALMRRKGRGATLSRFRADDGDAATDDGSPVPAEVERLLTAGLGKADHDAMYGLDHQRLRSGGRALLEGEGELGAALFEASAGVRSIPALLERLDELARQHFVKSGKKGRINEALRSYEEHHRTLRDAVVLPRHWAELQRRHEAAAGELEAVEARQLERSAALSLVKELRAVAPLLGAVDQASATLAELAGAPLLAPDCGIERTAAETMLAQARLDARLAAEEGARQQAVLAAVQPDPALLDAAAAIERFGAAAESVSLLRTDLAQAGAEAAAAQAEIDAVATHIDPSAGSGAVLAKAPSATARAAVEEALQRSEKAAQALEHHRASPVPAPAAESEADGVAEAGLPPVEVRTALRAAVQDAARLDVVLARLDALPREVDAARRAAAAALAAVGAAAASALGGMQPLLDADIDAALRQRDALATRAHDLRERLREMAAAQAERSGERDDLLAAGAVPTRDEVLAARERRDDAWRRWRRRVAAGATADADAESLAQACEQAVATADRLVDELARDSRRAARLQACLHGLAQLERDIALRGRELAVIDEEERDVAAAWSQRLQAAGLPPVEPQALREWQARLVAARKADETLADRMRERSDGQTQVAGAAGALREALIAAGLTAPPPDAGLRSLLALAAGVEQDFRQREQRRDTATGERREREQRRNQWLAREADLQQRLDAAQQAARPLLGGLLLPAQAPPAVARARLDEFARLRTAAAALDAALRRLARSRDALSALQEQAQSLAARLGEPAPGDDDLRLQADRLAARLASARRAAADRALAQQAHDGAVEAARRHEAAAAHRQSRLDALCRAAGVAGPLQLPEAEERSQRRREAQAALDRSLAQLAEASRLPQDELRRQLGQRDPAGLDANEAACEQALAALDAELRTARAAEETSRRDLEAIGSAATAADARERMEQAAAGARAAVGPWLRSRLAHALLAEATRRFRERAQGPMLTAASAYFQRMTGGEFVRLLGDDSELRPVLRAQRRDGARLKVEALSEGTCDQLYLALRLAALDIRRAAGVDLPVVLDDVLMTSDDRRAGLMLQALADFARGGQVIVFTHHEHLAEVARRNVDAGMLRTEAL